MRRQQAARYKALAHVEHQRRRRQPWEQGPDTIYHLEMEPGRTWMRGGQAEQSSAAVQGSDAGQVEGGKVKQGKGARQQGLQGKGQGRAGLHRVGGKGRGAMGRQGNGQGKESGLGYMGSPSFPGKGLGWWGGVVLPAVPPIVPPFLPPPIPGDGDDVPAPAGVPGHAATGAHAEAPAGPWDSVGGAGREGRKAREGVGEVRGGREEPAGEGGQGQG